MWQNDITESGAGLVPLTEGQIILNQRDLSTIAVEKRKIGMIFQDYALFPHLTVAQNIAFGLGQASKSEQSAVVAEMAELVQLSAYLSRYPHELSGGQQQRVAIARSLACKPVYCCWTNRIQYRQPGALSTD